MALEPKVTGLSPMTGPPGTKITVRGENFGQSGEDIIRLTIHGMDCLPYLEWKSSKKLITRCSKALGSGDIVITTNSGGVGTCDVQFNCYEEKIGLTDESAVWVEESDFQSPEREKMNTVTTNEEHSIEISSTRFNPKLFLIHNYSNASLDELRQVQNKLRSDLATKIDPEVMSTSSTRATLLKSNLPVIMECLQTLEQLNKVIVKSKNSTIDDMVGSIEQNLTRIHEMFDPLLEQKDLVQLIESAMQVFRRNGTLFDLPSSIEASIKNKNYDTIVKEISDIQSRLQSINIDPHLAERIQKDVTSRVQGLITTIEDQLEQSCSATNEGRNIDEVKKLISHLNKLGGKFNFDTWTVLQKMSQSLINTLDAKHDQYLNSSLQNLETSQDEPPHVVEFALKAITIFQSTYYDMLSLGQSDDIKQSRQEEFDRLIPESVIHLCRLLRQALVPDSPKLDDQQSRWPPIRGGVYVKWLKRVLQAVIACHLRLKKVNSAKARAALEDFREFVFELRVRSMHILFEDATQCNKNLHNQEDWIMEVDDIHGGTTRLPSIFEGNVIETLRFANETIFNLADEKPILKEVPVQSDMKELARDLINSLLHSFDKALSYNLEYPTESTRMLITICNCQYTKDKLFIKLKEEFEKLEGLKMDKVFKVCSERYCEYINKISKKLCQMKCEVLSDKMDRTKDLQVKLMQVHAEIFLVAPQLVNSLMVSIINSIQANY